MTFDPTTWANAPEDTPKRALDRALQACPDRIFLDFEGVHHTYREFDELSTRMANALGKLGIKAGDTVVTMLDNGIDGVVCWFAVNKLGGIWVPLNTAYRGEFLKHQVADSLASLVICESHYALELVKIADGLPDVSLILFRGETDLSGTSAIRVEPLDDHRGDDLTPTGYEPDPAEIACLIYTSGTTGPSKGCMISYNYLCQAGRQHNEGVPPEPGDIVWTCLPMFHIGATGYGIIGVLLAQTTMSIARQFSASRFWDEIERSGANSALILASILPLVANAPDTDAMKRCFGQLRAITGTPMTPELRAKWAERFGVYYCNSYGYGQTEISKLGHHRFGEPTPPEYSAGRACDDFDVMILDDDGKPVAPGVPGEIVARPRKPNIMFAGYWRRPADTAKVWKDLWMHTGDIGKLDEAGYLYFVDRKKDYVRNRGENISSFEVEMAFAQHPAVHECAFHAVSGGPGREDDIKITIVCGEGEKPDHGAIFDWAQDNLPHFAVPRYIEFRKSLPKTPTGRIQKHHLRDEGCTSETWDAQAAGKIATRRNRA